MIEATYTQSDVKAITDAGEAFAVERRNVAVLVNSLQNESDIRDPRVVAAMTRHMDAYAAFLVAVNAPIKRWQALKREAISDNLHANKPADDLYCPECGAQDLNWDDPAPAEPDVNIGPWRGGYTCLCCAASFERPEQDDEPERDDLNGAAVLGTKSPRGADRSECTHPREVASAAPAIATTPSHIGSMIDLTA